MLARQLDHVSRAEIQRWVRSGAVTVNGESVRPSYRVAAGDAVLVRLPEDEPVTIEPLEMQLAVLYEDRDCVVIDKPAGLVVHPATSHRQDTLVNALLYRYPEMADMVDPETEGGLRPGIVHRLDRDTSGLMVVARRQDARSELQRQFKAREVEKGYQALVHGRITDPEGRISAPIGRDPRNRQRMGVVSEGRDAITEYTTREYLFAPRGAREHYTLVDVRLLTGRTHQIRVHFAHLGHPVVGDSVYGRRRKRLACPRQFLHACRLGFHRPGDGEWMCFERPLPPDLKQVLSQLQAVT
jgi:23S rRNA pseudouridine1911/1915/1917 synthase